MSWLHEEWNGLALGGALRLLAHLVSNDTDGSRDTSNDGHEREARAMVGVRSRRGVRGKRLCVAGCVVAVVRHVARVQSVGVGVLRLCVRCAVNVAALPRADVPVIRLFQGVSSSKCVSVTVCDQRTSVIVAQNEHSRSESF